jgi:hypothetical protein
MSLSKDEILTAGAVFKTKEIDVPALGGSVFIREVNARELDRIQVLCGRVGSGSDQVKLFRAECCAYFLSDAEGKRMFGDNMFERVGNLNAQAINDIMQAGLKLNGLADNDDDPVETEVKNSETAQ